MATEAWAVGLVFIASIIGSVGALFLKLGAKKYYKKLFFGILFYIISTSIFVIALRGGEVSVLYPLVSLTYVWIALLSKRFLNEKMTKYKWLAISLIIIGVILVKG